MRRPPRCGDRRRTPSRGARPASSRRSACSPPRSRLAPARGPRRRHRRNPAPDDRAVPRGVQAGVERCVPADAQLVGGQHPRCLGLRLVGASRVELRMRRQGLRHHPGITSRPGRCARWTVATFVPACPSSGMGLGCWRTHEEEATGISRCRTASRLRPRPPRRGSAAAAARARPASRARAPPDRRGRGRARGGRRVPHEHPAPLRRPADPSCPRSSRSSGRSRRAAARARG